PRYARVRAGKGAHARVRARGLGRRLRRRPPRPLGLLDDPGDFPDGPDAGHRGTPARDTRRDRSPHVPSVVRRAHPAAFRRGRRRDARRGHRSPATDRAHLAHPVRRRVRSEDRDPRVSGRSRDAPTRATGAPGRSRHLGPALALALGLGGPHRLPVGKAPRRMAANQESLDRPQHLAGLLALALLALTTALAFGRAYQQHGPTWRLVATALASLAVATLFERRSLFLASLVSAAALLLVLGLLVFPTTTWHGLALGRTLHAIRDALGHVGQQARVQVAPTPPVAPLIMAGVTAVWTAVFSAHAPAVRAGSPLLAALPPAALVGFADTVLEDGARPVYAIAFLIAVLLVVFADGLRRIRQWGPVWGVSRRRISAAGQGAQRVALVAVAVAALAPGILPGFRSGALIDFSTVNRGSVHIDPFVSIRAELRRTNPVELFRVTSTDTEGKPAPTYWRLYALDQFDGTTWKSSDPQGAHARVLATPVQLAGTFPPTAPVIQQRYEIVTDLGDRWLPMAYPPQLVQVPFGTIRFDQGLTAAMAPENLDAGTEYVVTSRYVSPTPDELDRVTFGPPSQYGQATFVPPDVPAQVRRIAQQWTADAASPYRKVLAIQDRFLDGS